MGDLTEPASVFLFGRVRAFRPAEMFFSSLFNLLSNGEVKDFSRRPIFKSEAQRKEKGNSDEFYSQVTTEGTSTCSDWSWHRACSCTIGRRARKRGRGRDIRTRRPGRSWRGRGRPCRRSAALYTSPARPPRRASAAPRLQGRGRTSQFYCRTCQNKSVAKCEEAFETLVVRAKLAREDLI